MVSLNKRTTGEANGAGEEQVELEEAVIADDFAVMDLIMGVCWRSQAANHGK